MSVPDDDYAVRILHAHEDEDKMYRLMTWAEHEIVTLHIRLDSHHYRRLLQGVDRFDVKSFRDRQRYFKYIFRRCLEQAQPNGKQ